MFPPVPANESEALAVIDRDAVLDAPSEPFDGLVRLAATICRAPIAQITLAETTRQWMSAAPDIPAQAIARASSFFARAIGGDDVFVVEDAHADSRFARNPCVLGEPFIRSYAGAPLVSADGRNLGTLCVMDTKPHRFDGERQLALVMLARQAMMQLELRQQVDELRCREAHSQSVAASEHEVERMKCDFIATVSHELRTPLTSIHGSLGLLASGVMGELPREAKVMVSVAQRNSVRLLALVNDILDVDKLESGKIEMHLVPTSLMAIIERAIEMIRPLAAQDGVSIEVTGPHAQVRGDEARLGQVVANFLSNAVKYSPRDGIVSVSVGAVGEMLEVRVRDRGRGIGADLQKKLFQRFQRADSSDARTRPGAGLGLAICKAIVEQHGGTIGVESCEGEGSAFWFRVPRAVEEPAVLLIREDAALLDAMTAELLAGKPVRGNA
jgi:signal transduction histidine kinase